MHVDGFVSFVRIERKTRQPNRTSMVGILALASLARIERHQPGIAPRRRGIDRDRAFAGKAVEIMRAAGLRAGARKPSPPNGCTPTTAPMMLRLT